MLTAIVFLPLIAAVVIAVFLKEPRHIRGLSVVATTAAFLLSLAAFGMYDLSDGGLQLEETYDRWFPDSFNVQYHLGVDGLSVPMLLLSTLLGLGAVLVSLHISVRVKEYFIWLLVLQTAVTGVFVSLDLVLFFIFWEIELVPMYLLISIWGTGRKEYSAMKFLIFTLVGSAFMLVGILVVFFSVDTFSISELAGLDGNGGLDAAKLILPAWFVFALFFTAFAVKLPVPPVHTWLPDAHTDAPTAVSVMLAGVLIKMGGYGMIRVCVSIFPGVSKEAAGVMAVLAVVAILYGAMVTLRQTDLKRLVAYSSISHMGYVLLGISSVGAATVSSVGLTGAAMQMFTHGTITGLLFMLVGLVYEKAHTRYLPHLGGLASRMPLVAVVFLVAGLASLGLPGLSGFVSELLVFLGTFPVYGIATALGVFGIVITAGYILWTVRQAMFGTTAERVADVGDATLVETVPLALMVGAIVVIGIYPAFLTDVFQEGISTVVGRFP